MASVDSMLMLSDNGMQVADILLINISPSPAPHGCVGVHATWSGPWSMQ
jgi:hypothetical protein